jgi:HSP20 family molecular chaperone IbpA
MVTATTAMLVLGAPCSGEDESGKHPQRILEKSRDLQERMSRHFQDRWNELLGSVEGKAAALHSLDMASVDVRERHDGYTVRAHLPGRDLAKVEVAFEQGKILRITAPAEQDAGRYEQTITLEEVAPGAEPTVQRRAQAHLIVIELPKKPSEGGGTAQPERPARPPDLAPAGDPWDRQVLERMDRICREMDRMFEDTIEDWEDLPAPGEFFDRARFGSAVDLQEKDGTYVIRAYLPERDAQNAKVVVDDGVLKIEAAAEESSERGETGLVWRKKSQFVQAITLPGPVDPAGLAIERKQGLLVVTLPKAK